MADNSNALFLADLCHTVFEDLLQNLTHDVVLQAHQSEKLLRTQQQQHLAHKAMLSRAGSAEPPDGAASSSPPVDPREPQMPQGNPLSSIPEILYCPRCHLPRHTLETMGQGLTVTDKNGNKQKYCSKLPWQGQSGHDIYGNLFPNPNAPTTKKKKGAGANTGREETPTNGDSGTPGTPMANGDVPEVIATGKPAKNSGIVPLKCTNCKDDKIASTRYAQHLEKCLGLAGRKSSRAAMAKMTGSNGGSGQPSPMIPARELDSGKNTSRRGSPAIRERTPPATGEEPAKGSFTSAPLPLPQKKKTKKAGSVPVSTHQSSVDPLDAPMLDAPQTTAPIPLPESITQKVTPVKKRKRKTDTHTATGTDGGAGGEESIAVKPTPKKLKVPSGSSAKKTTPAEGSQKKNPLNNFKNRGVSPAPPIVRKAPEMTRSESNLSTSSLPPPTPNPGSSSPSKPLPGSMSPGLNKTPTKAKTSKPKAPSKPKPESLTKPGTSTPTTGSGMAPKKAPVTATSQSVSPEMKKKVVKKVKKPAASGASPVPKVAGKTAPTMGTKVGGKTAPAPVKGVARKGVADGSGGK